MGFNNKKSIFILLLIILIFSTIVYASSKYDVTDDGGVNLDDVAMVSNLVGSDVEACPRCDVNDDGKIDITDIKLVEDNQDNNKESTKENKDIEAFVTRFYQQCLEREPDKAGLDGWVNGLKTCSKTGADVANGFIFSPEFINRSTTNEEFVTILYRAFFDREPDPGGYAHWVNELNSGKTREYVLNEFIYSQEFKDLCDKYGVWCNKEEPFPCIGLKGVYINSDWGFILMERVDETINFDWGADSPDELVPKDAFEVNWAGQVKIDKDGKYTFYTETDDGVRLWIDKVEYFEPPEIDDWNDGGKENKVDLELQEGWHEIRMDYYENKGDASAKLFYSSDEIPRQIIPAQSLRPLDVILKIRTEKDQYKVGEKIHLTGNSDDKADPGESGKKESETKGFIVQLESKPTLEVVNDLITEVKKKEMELESSSLLYKYSMGLIDRLNIEFKKMSTKNKIKKQNSKLNIEHTEASKAIEKALNKKLSNTQNDNDITVLSMHTAVFNGIALDISLEDALKLGRLDLVKNIYPNYIMHTVLTESVPNIKANKVWGLKDRALVKPYSSK